MGRLPPFPALVLLSLALAACQGSPSTPCPGPFPPDQPGLTPPVKLQAPNPQYTEEARKARIQGVVIVEGIVDCEGIYRDLRILEGLPMGLNEATLDALSRWLFEPAKLEGRSVSVRWTITVNFRLQ